MNLKMIQKYLLPALGVVFAIAAVTILITMVKTPEGGPAVEEITTPDSSEKVSTIDLRVQSIEKKIFDIEANIKKIYSNQVKLNESIGELIKEDDSTKVAQKDNRAYIAMIYQRVLDLELQVGNLGGGFNMRQQRPKEDTINPLIGTENLPKSP
jgi:hypothetical protein